MLARVYSLEERQEHYVSDYGGRTVKLKGLCRFFPSTTDRERDIAPMKRVAVHYFVMAFTRQYIGFDGIDYRDEPEAFCPRLVDLGARNKGFVKR